VDPRGPELVDAILSLTLAEVEVVPFFFRLRTGGVEDAFPLNTSIELSFDATIQNPLTGQPSATPSDSFSNGDLSAFATDISLLNAAAWDFVRFKAEFNLDVANTGVDLAAPRPGLDFVRIPYRF